MKIIKFKTREEWLTQRNKGIGGSDVAIMYNKSPWTTKQELMQMKANAVIDNSSSNPITEMGHIMEPMIFNNYVKKDYPDAVAHDDEMYINEKYPALQASLDASTDDLVIEIKFANLYATSKYKNEKGEWELPKHYFMQVQHYLTVMEKKRAIVYVFMQELADVVKFDVLWSDTFAYNLNIDSIDFMEEVKNLVPVPREEVINEPKVVEPLIGEIHGLAKQTKVLDTKRKGLIAQVIGKYPVGTRLAFNNLNGKVSERKLKAGMTTTLKVS